MKRLEGYDLVILLMAVALTSFGVVMVYSASSVMAVKKFHDGFYFLKRQGLYALLGFGVMGIAMSIDYEKWRRYAVPLLFGCMVLLVLVFVPGIGGAAKGASRWIRLPGFNFQPSELAKIALIFYMAYSLDKTAGEGEVLFNRISSLHGAARGPARVAAQAARHGRGPYHGSRRHPDAVRCRHRVPATSSEWGSWRLRSSATWS